MRKAVGTKLTRRDWLEAAGLCLAMAIVILAILGALAIYLEVK